MHTQQLLERARAECVRETRARVRETPSPAHPPPLSVCCMGNEVMFVCTFVVGGGVGWLWVVKLVVTVIVVAM